MKVEDRIVDEAGLVRKLKRKQRGALEKAIEVYTPYLSVVLFNFCGTSLPEMDIEEIVSDTYVSLWKNAENLNLQKGSIRSYLATIAKNLARRKLEKVTPDYLDISEVEIASEELVTDEIESAEQREYIWKQVMMLGEPDNEIFVRYYKYGEKIREISANTGLNTSAIKSKLLRGRQKLKLLLSDKEGLL